MKPLGDRVADRCISPSWDSDLRLFMSILTWVCDVARLSWMVEEVPPCSLWYIVGCLLLLQDRSSEELRGAAAAVLAALGRAGGSHIWSNGGAAWEDAVRLGVAGLEDPHQASLHYSAVSKHACGG